MTTAGDVALQTGMAAHLYLVNAPMRREYFTNADGELLVVPQQGALRFATEFGVLEVGPGEVCLLPRGVKFRAEPIEGAARGFVCENYATPLTLPRSEEHTSELQSLMRISYAVFCLKKKKIPNTHKLELH